MGDVIDAAAELWCVVTWTSTASVAALAITVSAMAGAAAARTRRTPTREIRDLKLRKMTVTFDLPPGVPVA